jgi:hypothetical protein
MTQFADQLDKQHLINLALEKYEKSQRAKLPSVVVNLTSQGKIYPETHPLRSGKIEIRHMTAYDEDILTNASYIRERILFDKLLESVVVTPISIKEISTIDRDGILLNIRTLAYGAEYPVLVKDPKTGTELQRVVNLSKLNINTLTLDTDENGETAYVINDNHTIKFSYQNINLSDDATITDLLISVIKQVNDTRSVEDIKNFIRYEFLAGDSKKFRNFIFEHIPSVDLSYEFEGDTGSTFRAGFPLGPDLFWF